MSRKLLSCFISALIFTVACVDAQWNVVGKSGVAAMHAMMMTPTTILIIDKAENNPDAILPDGTTTWAAEYNLATNKFRSLKLSTNTFCSAGAMFGNGTFLSTAGGEPSKVVTAADGYRGIRYFQPCEDGTCQIIEVPSLLSSARWYNTMVTMPSGDILNIGGSTVSTGANSASKNNPTFEIHSPNSNNQAFQIQFLVDTLPYNLYPFVHVIPNGVWQGYYFIFANKASVIYDITKNVAVQTLPEAPGGIRSYPCTGGAALLPLDYVDNYNPQFLVCGGQSVFNQFTNPAENTCARTNLGSPNPTWEADDFGGVPRVMPDVVHLADGYNVLFLNGGQVGQAGYITGGGTLLSDKPAFTPVLYSMNKPLGQRWTQLTAATIPRMYHSVATLIPDGSVWVAGSNCNQNYNPGGPYPTEYRVENFVPPYLSGNARPQITAFNNQTSLNASPIRVTYNVGIPVTYTLTGTPGTITATIVQPGFHTHSQGMSMRIVHLQITNIASSGQNTYTATVYMPPNNFILPPGPHYVFILNNGTPCTSAVWVLIGW
ncbi:10960_t:CDS:2 [Paraglomus occultum]|uniref:10960_t:CDS:1 n=1 Tax=Paraglomus occultum TaxID=144539 RepID=A0A9N9CMF5_9GLOM|nr:10960_t:CDS:2 [Paraglomus occultum]